MAIMVAVRWQKDIDHISWVLSILGSLRPSARDTLYHPVCSAFCSLTGVLMGASSDSLLVTLIGFTFIPFNNWFAGIFFCCIAALDGWARLLAILWGFIHFFLSAIDTSERMSFIEHILLGTKCKRQRHLDLNSQMPPVSARSNLRA